MNKLSIRFEQTIVENTTGEISRFYMTPENVLHRYYCYLLRIKLRGWWGVT